MAYTNLAEGDYEARLISYCDLGLQEGQTYKGVKKKDGHQAALLFEILGQTSEITDDETGEVTTVPRIMWSKPFNVFSSLTEKGKEMELYKVFNPKAKPKAKADWAKYVENKAVCSVSIVNVTRGDNTYDNIDAILPIPEKFQKGIDEGDMDGEMQAEDKLFGLARYVFEKRID